MIKSTNNFKYAATLLGAPAVFAIAPAAAFAEDNDPSGPGGCTYTDADGYDIPIHDGEDVFVDGKIVSCRGGSIVVTTPPARVRRPRTARRGGNLPVLTEAGTAQPARRRRRRRSHGVRRACPAHGALTLRQIGPPPKGGGPIRVRPRPVDSQRIHSRYMTGTSDRLQDRSMSETPTSSSEPATGPVAATPPPPPSDLACANGRAAQSRRRRRLGGHRRRCGVHRRGDLLLRLHPRRALWRPPWRPGGHKGDDGFAVVHRGPPPMFPMGPARRVLPGRGRGPFGPVGPRFEPPEPGARVARSPGSTTTPAAPVAPLTNPTFCRRSARADLQNVDSV